LLFLGCITQVLAQTYSINGRIADEKDKSPLIGVNILLVSKSDTTLQKGTSTDNDGEFLLKDIRSGDYLLTVSYVSYKTVIKELTVSDAYLELEEILLTEDSKLLKEVIIEGKQIRVQQLGDTAQFNADAFKVNKDATTEDLLVKMPGITSENGTVKVNGEEVRKIFVDGKPFFGEDPKAAVQNLPAELIDKIQVFDRMSDQSMFTGFDDGNAQKAINIVTRNGIANSKIGRFYAGYGGTDNRYTVGLNFSDFKGDRRVSVLAMSNNINQQNFNIQDLVGATGSSGSTRGGGRGGMGRNSGVQNFLVGQQNGISTTTAFGLNYSDKLGKKKKATVSGSYFFNGMLNDNFSSTIRNYISSSDSGLVYNESRTAESKNFNNRINLRIEYVIDSSNTLIITPAFSTQHNNSSSELDAVNSSSSESVLSRTANVQKAKQSGMNFSNDILYQHKFAKKGRTISVNFTTSYNMRKTNGSLYTLNSSFSDSAEVADTIDQRSRLNTRSYSTSGSIVYTEPVRKFGQLSFTYAPSFTKTFSLKNTDNFDFLTDSYTLQDTTLSNQFNNTYIANKAGLAYRYNNQKLSWSVAINGQYALLNSEQSFPLAAKVKRSFLSLLPGADLNYRFSKTSNLRLFYRTSNNPPSITQLQNVIDNSNSLILTSGNPDLKQNFSQSLGFRYGNTNTEKATNIFVFTNATNTMNYIANSTTIFDADSLLGDIRVNAGTQFTQPVNLSGFWNVRTFVTYGFPITKMKSNMNVNGGFIYLRTPTLINNARNNANAYAFNTGFTLSSNISQKIDFTISYNGSFNLVRNTLQQQNNTNYFNHTASAKFNYQFWKGFVFNTSVTNSLNAGGSAAFNTSFWLLNASLAYKFLKDESLELKFSATDILNQTGTSPET
jgi:hypothetical protein